MIDRLEDVEESLRPHYGPTDGGKYILATQGESPKIAEFRERNVALLKDLARFEGIDPDAAKTALVRVKELEQANPDDRVKALEAELATEKAARTAAQQTADRGLLREQLRFKMLAAGVLPAAARYRPRQGGASVPHRGRDGARTRKQIQSNTAR